MPPAPDMFGCAEKVRTRALELERARMDERRRKEAWEKEENPYLFIKGGRNCVPPHLPFKIAYFPSATIDGAVGLPIPVLMRIP